MTTRRISITVPAAALLTLGAGVAVATMPFPRMPSTIMGTTRTRRRSSSSTMARAGPPTSRCAPACNAFEILQRLRSRRSRARCHGRTLRTRDRDPRPGVLPRGALPSRTEGRCRTARADRRLIGWRRRTRAGPGIGRRLAPHCACVAEVPEYFDHPGWKPVPALHQ